MTSASAALGAVVGLVTLALVLNTLTIWPQTYRWLTKWANQPPLPTIKSCKLMPQEQPLFAESPILKPLRSYRVEFVVETSLASNGAALAYSEDPRIGVYPEGYNSIPNIHDPPYLFLPQRDFKKKPLILTGVFDSAEGELEKLDFDQNECPIKVEIFGSKR